MKQEIANFLEETFYDEWTPEEMRFIEEAFNIFAQKYMPKANPSTITTQD